VDGRAPIGNQRLGKGTVVSYTATRREPTVKRELPVLFEDAALLVVDKPAPLPVHSDGVFIRNTAINILREKTKNPELALGHRLDRETSGVLVLVKQKALTAKVMAAFDDSGVEKQYLAVGRGEAAFKEELLRGWMERDPASKLDLRQRLSKIATPGGKDSATRFLVRERLKGYTLFQCQPLTGRTNQIRVHLEALGFPLAGDKLYGRTDEFYLSFVKHVKAGGEQDFNGQVEHPRHLLHAWKLSLRHPVSGERMSWEAPIPLDMQSFIDAHRT
jgi:23S rRNA pseudouridine1911/1915/1917 synthase